MVLTEQVETNRPLLQRVAKFFLTERLLIGASLMRVSLGLLALYGYVLHYQVRHFLWGPQAIFDWDLFIEGMSRGSFSLYQFSTSPLYFELIFHLGILVATLLTVGYKTRFMSVLHYVFVWSIHERNPAVLDGGDNITRIILVFMLFARWGEYFSMDAGERREENRESFRHRMLTVLHNGAMIAVLIQISILYAAAGLYKVTGEMWQNGTALYYVMRVQEFNWSPYSEWVYRSELLVLLLTYATVGFQVCFPFLVLGRITPRLAVLMATSFHVGIALFMGLITFSWAMITLDLTIFSDDDYRRVWSRMQEVAGSLRRKCEAVGRCPVFRRQAVQVFYDGWCPFCIRQTEMIKASDWFGLVEPISFRDEGAPEAHGLDPERAARRIHSRMATGGPLRDGIDAVIQVAVRVIPYWPLVPLLVLARVVGVGQWVYDQVAKRRRLVPVCSEERYTSGGS